MAWHYGTYSCGCDGRVDIVGPSKDRQWKADLHFENICPDCKQKEYEKENKIAEKKAASLGLRKLSGTKKQIAWANTIRQNFIDEFSTVMDNLVKQKERYPEAYEKAPFTLGDIERTFQYVLDTKLKASYWIDNRNRKVDIIIRDEMKNAPSETDVKNRERSEGVVKESTVYPNNVKHKATVEIRVLKNKVELEYEKNDYFINVVKDLDYRWDGSYWIKEITERTGSSAERAAEVGNKLLNEGFPVSILDEEIRNNAIKGNFEPEHTNWIFKITDKDQLKIVWDGYDDNLYTKARSLPGAYWDRGVVVNIAHFNEVCDFADLYDFKLTKVAQNAIDEFRLQKDNIDPVIPAKQKPKKGTDGLKAILESSDDILDDLKD